MLIPFPAQFLINTERQRRHFALASRDYCELTSDTKLLDDSSVSVDVLLLEVSKKVSSFTDHLEHTSSGVMIVLVALEVLSKVSDSLGEDSYLYLRRACVLFAGSVSFDNSCFFFFSHHGVLPLFLIFSVVKGYGR